MSKLSKTALPFPDFKLDEIIDPEQFDQNNHTVLNKVNELVTESNSQDDRLINVEKNKEDKTSSDLKVSNLQTQITKNTQDIANRYTKGEVDAKTTNLQNQITQNTQGVANRYTKEEVDTKTTNLRNQIVQNTSDITNRYTKDEIDTKTTNLQSQITINKEGIANRYTKDEIDNKVFTTKNIASNAITLDKLSMDVQTDIDEIIANERMTKVEDEIFNSVPNPPVNIDSFENIKSINVKNNCSLDVKMDGNMVVNLANNGVNYSNWDLTETGLINIKTDNINRIAINRNITLKAGTYTLIVNVVDHNLDSSYPYIGGYIKQINGTTKYGKMPITNCRDLFVIDDDANEVSLYLHDSLTSDKYAKINGVMILEGDWTNREVPYVESAQPINHPYVRIQGKNLETTAVIKTEVKAWDAKLSNYIHVDPTKPIYLKQNIVGSHRILLSFLDKNKNVIKTGLTMHQYGNEQRNFIYSSDTVYWVTGANSDSQNSLITIPANQGIHYISMGVGNGALATSVVATDRLISQTATNYEPYRESISIIPTYLAKIGDNKDKLIGIKGTKVLIDRKIERIKLDEKLTYEVRTNATGIKRINISPINHAPIFSPSNSILKKYNGKICAVSESAFNPDEYTNEDSGGKLVLCLSNADTGWGDSYTPSQEEIKAYFMGWKMYPFKDGTDAINELYNNEGTKAWIKQGFKLGGTTILPTQSYPEWTPYELFYVLETPHTEEVEMAIIGDSFSLQEGVNTVEVGTGLVLENTNPQPVSASRANYTINAIRNQLDAVEAHNPLKYKLHDMSNLYKCKEGVYRKDISSNWYNLYNNCYGKYRIACLAKDFDPQAEYYILYEMIPVLYTCGIENAEIIYSENVRDSLNNAVKQIGEISGDVSKLNLEMLSKLQVPEGYRMEIYVGILDNGKTIVFKKAFSEKPFIILQACEDVFNPYAFVITNTQVQVAMRDLKGEIIDNKKVTCVVLGR